MKGGRSCSNKLADAGGDRRGTRCRRRARAERGRRGFEDGKQRGQIRAPEAGSRDANIALLGYLEKCDSNRDGCRAEAADENGEASAGVEFILG
jgi:hypothetical protein